MVGTDTAAAFAPVPEAAIANAANTGALGSSRQKLAIGTTGNDLATSAGMGAVAADQATDQAYVQGLGAVSALGRGEKASAINGLAQSAAISGEQARADAEASPEAPMGTPAIV